MTDNLPVTIDLSDEELNRQLGITQESSGPMVARLKINSLAEDENEKPLQMGTFFIDEKDQPKAYAKEISMRVVTRVFQYQHFSQEEKKLLDESVMLPSLFSEFPSVSGRLKCGKLSKKQVEGVTLSPEQAKIQKEVKCRTFVFALVSFKGTTQDGKEIEYKDKPVLWIPSQSAFTIVGDMLESFDKQKRAAIKYPVELKLKKEKNGNVVYYNPVPKITNEPVTLTAIDQEAISSARDFIKSTNERVKAAYASALNKAPNKSDTSVGETVITVGAQVKKGADLDDEIPF